DRAVLEFLSLYANRLRRWMEQSIAALRDAFNAFADMYRARFEFAPAAAPVADSSAVVRDLQDLRDWNAANHAAAVSSILDGCLCLVLADWKKWAFTIEDTSAGGRIRDTNDDILKR